MVQPANGQEGRGGGEEEGRRAVWGSDVTFQCTEALKLIIELLTVTEIQLGFKFISFLLSPDCPPAEARPEAHRPEARQGGIWFQIFPTWNWEADG